MASIPLVTLYSKCAERIPQVYLLVQKINVKEAFHFLLNLIVFILKKGEHVLVHSMHFCLIDMMMFALFNDTY